MAGADTHFEELYVKTCKAFGDEATPAAPIYRRYDEIYNLLKTRGLLEGLSNAIVCIAVPAAIAWGAGVIPAGYYDAHVESGFPVFFEGGRRAEVIRAIHGCVGDPDATRQVFGVLSRAYSQGWEEYEKRYTEGARAQYKGVQGAHKK